MKATTFKILTYRSVIVVQGDKFWDRRDCQNWILFKMIKKNFIEYFFICNSTKDLALYESVYFRGRPLMMSRHKMGIKFKNFETTEKNIYYNNDGEGGVKIRISFK
jgi:hypothetical protein